MSDVIVLDIETYRTRNAAVGERIQDEAREKRPANNVAKEKKLEWDTERAGDERAREALAKTAIDVLLAEPLCVCWKWVNEEDPRAMDMTRYATSPVASLEAALDDLSEQLGKRATDRTIWVGHNLAGFDLAVLLNSWRRIGVEPPEHFPKFVDGRWRGRVFDTMKRTPCANGLGYIGLEAVCESYGIAGAKEVMWNGAPLTGARVGEAYEAGAVADIIRYCLSDVLVTEQLYLRMTCGGHWGTWTDDDELAILLKEIMESGLSEGAAAIAKLRVLEQAGLVPAA